MFADHGEIRIVRRHAGATDGGTGRYQRDGYFGVMEYVAFGAGFYRYTDWSRQDGDTWDYYIEGTGFQGEFSGSRPAGGATWEGRMVGHQGGLEAGKEPFVQGNAKVSVSFGRNQVDIGFTGVTSTDFKRSLADFGFRRYPAEVRRHLRRLRPGHSGGRILRSGASGSCGHVPAERQQRNGKFRSPQSGIGPCERRRRAFG